MAVRCARLATALVLMLSVWPVNLSAGPGDIDVPDEATPAQRPPGDIVFPERGYLEEIRPAVFPHWFHRIRFRCSVCHPKIFPMRVTGKEITMDAIREGKFCGTCHGTDTAWGPTFDTCSVCHSG